MPVVVAMVSQKGGVGKSTLARGLAALAAHAGVKVRIADLDAQQPTSVLWERVRREGAIVPAIDVVGFDTVEQALEGADDVDLLIIDAPGRTDRSTLAVAQRAHLIVQPTGPSRDDLYPGVLLFHELTRAGVPPQRLVFALCRTATKDEGQAARIYVQKAGYSALAGALPERSQYRAAQNTGHAVTETRKQDLNARADALMVELLGRVMKEIEELRAHQTTRRSTNDRA